MSVAPSASEPRGVELGSSPEDIWSSVERLIDRTDDLRLLRAHRLELLAAHRWRALGRQLPERLLAEERSATARLLAARTALARVRAVYDGPMTTYKGLSAAAVYPDPATRPFGDIDVLVPNAEEVQQILLAAGCVEVGDPELFVDIHHLRPLMWPRLPIPIEIHDRPKWPDELPAPNTADLFAAAAGGEWGEIVGVPTLPRTYHAVLLAAHAWAHEPLRRALDLVEVAAMAHGIERAELQEAAGAFGLDRIWRTTIGAADALLFDEAPGSLPLRLWARHLPAVRERTVAEAHLEHWLSGYWSLPPSAATRKLGRVLSREFRPAWDETWRGKLSRTLRALRRAFVARSRHDELLGDAASRGGFRGRDSDGKEEGGEQLEDEIRSWIQSTLLVPQVHFRQMPIHIRAARRVAGALDGIGRKAADLWLERHLDTADSIAKTDHLHPERVWYQPSAWSCLKRALREEKVGAEDVFVDFGSGKGRVLYQAAHYPFKRVVGVEITQSLNESAQRNIDANRARLVCKDVEIVTQDCAEFEIPDDMTMAYMYHPFIGETFNRVMENMVASLERNPRRLRLVYVMPVMEEAVLATGRFELKRNLKLRYRGWPHRIAIYEHRPPA